MTSRPVKLGQGGFANSHIFPHFYRQNYVVPEDYLAAIYSLRVNQFLISRMTFISTTAENLRKLLLCSRGE
jgi:hypothetical protein